MGGQVAKIFHAVLSMFTGLTREEAATRVPLPCKSSIFNHRKVVENAEIAHMAAAVLTLSYPFFGIEADEAHIRRSHILIVLLTYQALKSNANGTENITDRSVRAFGGAPRIPSTSGKSELGGIMSVVKKLNWSILYWLHFTSDSASSCLMAAKLAAEAKKKAFIETAISGRKSGKFCFPDCGLGRRIGDFGARLFLIWCPTFLPYI